MNSKLKLYGEYGKNKNGYWMYMGNNLYDLVDYKNLTAFEFWLYRIVDFVGSGGNVIWERSDTCIKCNNDIRLDHVGEYMGALGDRRVICKECKI